MVFARNEEKRFGECTKTNGFRFEIQIQHVKRAMSSLQNSKKYVERRTETDRRKKNPPLFSKYLLKGMRTEPRRKEERQKPQRVDRYNSKILGLIVLILTLSILDAMLTLFLVENGAKEVNPLLAYYLKHSPLIFLAIKYFLTSAAVILILFCKDFYIFNTKIKARILFFLLPIPFFLVIQWQLILIFSGF